MKKKTFVGTKKRENSGKKNVLIVAMNVKK